MRKVWLPEVEDGIIYKDMLKVFYLWLSHLREHTLNGSMLFEHLQTSGAVWVLHLRKREIVRFGIPLCGR